MARYITVWRKRDKPLEWDFHISEDYREAAHVHSNLVDQDVQQGSTYELGPDQPELGIGRPR